MYLIRVLASFLLTVTSFRLWSVTIMCSRWLFVLSSQQVSLVVISGIPAFFLPDFLDQPYCRTKVVSLLCQIIAAKLDNTQLRHIVDASASFDHLIWLWPWPLNLWPSNLIRLCPDYRTCLCDVWLNFFTLVHELPHSRDFIRSLLADFAFWTIGPLNVISLMCTCQCFWLCMLWIYDLVLCEVFSRLHC